MIQQNQHGASAIATLPSGEKLFFRWIMFGAATAVARNALAIAGIHFVGGSLLASRAPPECDQLYFHTFHTLLEFSVWMSDGLGESSEFSAAKGYANERLVRTRDDSGRSDQEANLFDERLRAPYKNWARSYHFSYSRLFNTINIIDNREVSPP